LTNQTQFTIPPGYTVPAGGFLLVWADSDAGQNTTNSPDLHVNFKLGQPGEGIWLFAPNGTNIDGVTFGPQTNDVSQGRWPDGNSGQYYFMVTPTPSAANIVGAGNSSPLLASIGNKSTTEGSPLTFAAIATDPDNGQALTYSLDPGAPSGATINSSSGVFLWTPTEAQGPGSYNVTVRVTDNGSPALSDSETITVTVTELNSSPSLAFIGDRTVNEGSLLTFTAMATDPDLPANTLTFSLDLGAPAGAVIDPASGVFTWTPSSNQAPSTNAVTVRVTDNGSPALSDSATFAIIANTISPLRVTGVSVSGANVVTLNWISQAGKTYRVEFKDSLAETAWNTLGDFNGTSNTTSATNSVSGTPQRFYRIQQMN
jgi:hypothetical protein